LIYCKIVVIGSDGQLDYSDRVRLEDTGQPDNTRSLVITVEKAFGLVAPK
jgi:hypothetical protein